MCPYFQLGRFKVMAFPSMLMLGIGICLLIRCCGKRKFPCMIYEMRQSSLFGLVFACLGGKLLFLLTRLRYFITENIGFVEAVKQLGFVFYGGMLGFLLGLWLWAKKKKEVFYKYSDAFLIFLPLGQFFGRIGCWLNGCCYGKVTDSRFGVLYPINGEVVKVVPIQLVEAVGCLILFLFLINWRIEKRGWITYCYLVVYSVIRFVLEFYRGDMIRGGIGYLSTSQIIAVIVIGVSVRFWIKEGVVNCDGRQCFG